VVNQRLVIDVVEKALSLDSRFDGAEDAKLILKEISDE
jgi:hypothetical protein